MEMLMTFDEKMNPTGPKERSKVHTDGDWHETFHCWFYETSPTGSVLYFQKRAADKSEFPSLYDITAAGHIDAGESVEAAGLREIEEEVGVVVTAEQLRSIGSFKEVLTTSRLLDREICHTYLWEVSPTTNFNPGPEVTDLITVKTEDVKLLLNQPFSSVPYQSVLDHHEGYLTKSEIVPHEDSYFRFILHHFPGNVEKL